MAAHTAGCASRAGTFHPGGLDHRDRVRPNDRERSREPGIRSGHHDVRRRGNDRLRLSDRLVREMPVDSLPMGAVRAGAGRHQRRGDHHDHRRQPERYGTSGLHCA